MSKHIIKWFLESIIILSLAMISVYCYVAYQEFEKILECEKTYQVCELVAIPK